MTWHVWGVLDLLACFALLILGILLKITSVTMRCCARALTLKFEVLC
jgi:hypothetical protein